MNSMASRRPENTRSRSSSAADVSEVELLLHPELLSHEFIQLVLQERKIAVDDDGDRDRLTDVYMRHVVPLPQRELRNSRWAKSIERGRGGQSSSSADGSSTDRGRKRPLIVFDGSSSNTGSVKLKKPDTSPVPVVHDRLKPPVSSVNFTNPIRKLSGSSTNGSSSNSHNTALVSAPGAVPKSPSATCNNSNTANSSVHSNTMTSKLKRTAPSDAGPDTAQKNIKSPDMKKKVQHITWP